jgi:hypothetical protein
MITGTGEEEPAAAASGEILGFVATEPANAEVAVEARKMNTNGKRKWDIGTPKASKMCFVSSNHCAGNISACTVSVSVWGNSTY